MSPSHKRHSGTPLSQEWIPTRAFAGWEMIFTWLLLPLNIFPVCQFYHSKDLVHWKLIGHALSRPENNPLIGCNASTGGQYAPALRYHDGTFYVVGTNYGGKRFARSILCDEESCRSLVWSGMGGELVCLNPSIEFIDGKMYFWGG